MKVIILYENDVSLSITTPAIVEDRELEMLIIASIQMAKQKNKKCAK